MCFYFMDTINNYYKLNSKKGWRWILFTMVIALFLSIIVFFGHALTHPFTQSQFSEIKDTWTYFPKDDPVTTFKSRYIKKMPGIETGEAMIMERKMVRKVNNPMLLVQGNHQWIKVWIDDELIYEYSPASTGGQPSDNPGNSLQEIHLPRNYVGRTLEIEVSSPYKNYTGLPARVFVGEANSVMAYVFSVSMPQILMMIVALSISIVLLFFVGRTLLKKQFLELEMLLLACFAMTIGLEAAAGDIFSSLLFSPTVNSTLATLLAIMTPLFLISYYCLKMTHVQKYYKFWVIPHICFSIAMLIIAILTKTDLPEIKPWVDTMNMFGTLAATVAAIRESHYKNHFYAVCTPWIVLVALAHCFLYIMGLLGTEYTQINFSGLFFGAILLVLFGYTITDFMASEERNRRQVNFLEVKTTLLEESRQEMQQHMAELEQMKTAFKKNLQMMQLLAEDGNLEGTKEYLDKLMKDTRLMDGIPRYTDHTLANLILSRYQKLAQKRSIAIDFQVLLPEEINISDDDLTKLLAHLLEHASRETYAIADPKQRKIRLQVTCDQDQLYLFCEHTANYQENIFDRGIDTELPEKEEFDLWVLESISKKYAGHLKKAVTEKTDSVEIRMVV